jgi:hypothetical protein
MPFALRHQTVACDHHVGIRDSLARGFLGDRMQNRAATLLAIPRE